MYLPCAEKHREMSIGRGLIGYIELYIKRLERELYCSSVKPEIIAWGTSLYVLHLAGKVQTCP